jgi:hypothetical protein
MRGQAIAIALVVAAAVASYVTMRGAYESLLVTQRIYYDIYRFATSSPRSRARRSRSRSSCARSTASRRCRPASLQT